MLASAAHTPADVLLAKLERARTDFERAKSGARTYLVGQDLDQTQVDLVAALKRFDRKALRVRELGPDPRRGETIWRPSSGAAT